MQLENLTAQINQDFKKSKYILSFQQFFQLLAKNPYRYLRNAANFTLDMMDYFGTEEVIYLHRPIKRYKVFNKILPQSGQRLIGQEQAQNEIYKILENFQKDSKISKMIMLHGPNGSAKSSMISALIQGLEDYSQCDEGVAFTFNWVFPRNKIIKKSMGFVPNSEDWSDHETYAFLDDSQVSTRIYSELKDSPFYLFPQSFRKELYEKFLAGIDDEKTRKKFQTLKDSLILGDLSHKNKIIFENLLKSLNGDFDELLRHVQIERIFFSHRFSNGLVTIEPQMTVDAGLKQITADRSIHELPASLQNLNLYSPTGALVNGNRGLVEFSDLLKRPIEAFKYLLGTCETQTISLGDVIAYLDTVLIGSCNEQQLNGFKEYPDYASFKARMEFVQVPYLLDYKREAQIYEELVKRYSGEKDICPHTTEMLALWSVLTRLRKPQGSRYPSAIKNLVEKITPLEKARIYALEEIPNWVEHKDWQNFRALIPELVEEFSGVPFYEGVIGASPREMKFLLHKAIISNEKKVVSFLSVLQEIHAFIKKKNDYEFLRIEKSGDYFNFEEITRVVELEYLRLFETELKDSIGLHSEKQYLDFMTLYMLHITRYLRKEKVYNEITKKWDEPNLKMIEEFESYVGVTENAQKFREDCLTRVGAFSVENAVRLEDSETAAPASGSGGMTKDYYKIFPELLVKLKDYYYLQEKELILKISDIILDDGNFEETKEEDVHPEYQKLAKETITHMSEKYHYSLECFKEVLAHLININYHVASFKPNSND